jgi:glycosyltransferase involved in cell wall biosynthesis
MNLFYLARIDIASEDANSRHVIEFCRHFGKLGNSVTLFLPDLGKRTSVEGVDLVYIPVLIRRSAVTYFSFYCMLFLLLPYYCIKMKPDVVYTRHQQMEWISTCLKFIFKFTYVAEVNGLSTVELKINRQPAWIIRLTGFVERYCFRLADIIVTPAPKIRDYLIENYSLNPQKFVDVTNGADPDVFYPMEQASCRKKLGLPEQACILLFSGSFKKWHGIGKVIQIFPEVIKKIPNAILVLVGDGEERQAMQDHVKANGQEDSIQFLGRRPFAEIPEYINSADLCLAPYFDPLLNETGISPIKIYEYMSCGKAIISSPVGGLEKLFQEYQIGVMVDSFDAEDWGPALETVLQDPQQLKTWGNNGRQATLTTFSWEAICKKIASDIKAHGKNS